MEEKKEKKKKLTLSVSLKKPYNVSSYRQNNKTSVVIEKKTPRKWGDKKFQSRDSNFNKPKSTSNFGTKKPPVNRNFDIRKIAEERATKRFKNLKEDSLQSKKNNLRH